MLSFIFAVVLVLITLLTIVLSKAYQHVPAKELKREARSGNDLAKTLYRAVAYGASTQTLLNILMVITAGGSFVLLATNLPAWFALLLIFSVLAAGFVWLPTTHLSNFGMRLAYWCTPAVAWLLHYMHGPLDVLSREAHAQSFTVHSGLYEKDDLLELLAWQKEQPDSRISTESLAVAEKALAFGDKKVSDVLIPRSQAKTVKSSDTIGPILLDELHKSGYSYFPVIEGKSEKVVGILYIEDAIDAKHGGKVSSIMHEKVRYVHEDFSLSQVLQAWVKTRQHLFIVVNNFKELVGIVTARDILEQVLGEIQPDEFDKYEDLEAVAEAKLVPAVEEAVVEEPEIVEDQPAEPEDEQPVEDAEDVIE